MFKLHTLVINYLISLSTRSFGKSEDQQQRHYEAQQKRPCHSEKNMKKPFLEFLKTLENSGYTVRY